MATLIDDEDDTTDKEEQHQLVLIEGDNVIMDVDPLPQDNYNKIKPPSQTSMGVVHDATSRSGDTMKLELAGDAKLAITNNAEELNPNLQVERIQLSGESLDHSPRHTAADACTPSTHINSNDCKESAGTISGPENGTVTDGVSVSDIGRSPTPDFSILKGEVCLDNFSIRELQEAFRASFGRDTTVKDKLWLKRRIAMGLINSCDIPTTSFVIKNNKIIYTDIKEEASCGFSSLKNEVDSLVKDDAGDFPGACSETLLTGTTNNFTHKQLAESTSDCQMDQFATKRARKPTRRYIEELSDLEAPECSAKVAVDVMSSSKYQIGFLDNVSKRKSLAIRYDSFGGFGILIPYASRVRIGRPRKNIMALMKYHPSGMLNSIMETDCSARPEEKGTESVPVCMLEPRYHPSGKSNNIMEIDCSALPEKGTGSVPVRLLEPSFSNTEEVEINSEKFLCKDEPYIENNGLDANEDIRDDNIDSRSLEKTVGKRNQHRAWTLCEILKLVEGVATYGVGRWSEIRRLVFTAYSYRTSVDLKDKWRNLLRASLAQGPAGKGAGSLRKQTSTPIPPAVLSRVRELAELNGQTGIQLKPSKVAKHGGKVVKGTGPGFL